MKKGRGLCFAKSHLLAALLRSQRIPCGFCYQLLVSSGRPVLHGLVAVYLQSEKKWIRLDARGNKNGINAQFSALAEKLAFTPDADKGEKDFPYIYARPDSNVIAALRKCTGFERLVAELPAVLCDMG